jgi:ABC transporter substrate binding protein
MYNFNTWTYWGPRISRWHLEPQARGVLTHSLCWGAPSWALSKHRFLSSWLRAGFRQFYATLGSVDAGGLMSYGVNITDLDRRAATYVDKILTGAKPGELPVEQPKKFDFVINLKAAKQISLTIPPNVLARADRVIK